jgi:hypothetical protein
METVIKIIMLLILLELLELYFQKADTLSEMIEKLYGYYRKSVFLLFIVHPTFYYVLGVLLYFDAFNFYGITMIVLKTFDMLFKIEMIKQRYVLKEMDADLEKMMGMKMTVSMQFLGLFVHVPLLSMALYSILG